MYLYQDCPYNWSEAVSEDFPEGIASIAGKKTNIPEFHDCQRLLVPGGEARHAHGPLVGIFISQRIDALPQDLDTATYSLRESTGPCRPGEPGRVTVAGGRIIQLMECAAQGTRLIIEKQFVSQPRAVAVLQAYDFDGDYPPLGIGNRYNCLYFSLDNRHRYVAHMLRTGAQRDCPTMTVEQLNRAGRRLQVRADSSASSNAADYPPAARWDWDRERGEQYIGLKCGAAWCEVGRGGFQPSTKHGSAIAAGPDKKLFSIPGWYDEQQLATYIAPGQPMRLSAAIGVVVPYPHLDTLSLPHLSQGQYVPAWRVYLSEDDSSYKQKYGFTKAWPPGGADANIVSLQYKPDQQTMTALVDPADGSATRTKNVFRHDHDMIRRSGESFLIPGTTRWRWIAQDETTWGKCDYGCCSLDPR
jgi:hypothetical protein